ncbi:MAG TPA: glycosyltransferase [Solirubrobacteraceae bacterium]|nr:glycosyltransferase [Solirubrobacteraceae bacterium]
MATDLDAKSTTPAASIVVPTRERLDYLEVALASIAPQAASAAAELLVVDDAGASPRARELCERFGARYLPHACPLGLNHARNTAVAATHGELVVFVDDDVEVSPGWLAALLAAAREHPEVEVFTGPVRPRLEGSPPHTCGTEPPPITALDLGEQNALTAFAWGANMAIRRAALQRVGPFEPALVNGGDEQEWQERMGAGQPTQALYVAAAALEHRRDAADSRLVALCRAAYVRGRAARRFDTWRGRRPRRWRELWTLLACCGHVVRRRCPAGLTMVAHSAGRLREAFAGVRLAKDTARMTAQETSPNGSAPAAEDFLSGESGTVGGLDELRRAALDARDDALQAARARALRLDRAARRAPARRRVLALCVERPQNVRLADAIAAELARSRHSVELRRSQPGTAGKFENLNRLLAQERLDEIDWLLVLDDDIALPHAFLDRFLFLAERFALDLVQPSHRARSHAAWRVTRRRGGAVVRETRFVEIGPVTAFASRTFPTLLPFPPLRMGWGLDLHWAALAAECGWRCGVLDAVAIGHRQAPAASAYSREQALAEARAFLSEHPYLPATEAQRTLATHRRW